MRRKSLGEGLAQWEVRTTVKPDLTFKDIILILEYINNSIINCKD